ncbi:uncharacterized protein [Nicotiana sylvestris]|uniref:Uncharacterized protein LOC104226202 n=1 Tax=Nicotiana sylvestris TaxID=4096 RepID=A0A1U7WCN8_NICSY|nr:PREDICTED: uncharacterized protein LOC104226202 [Nicotiana sylvestris]
MEVMMLPSLALGLSKVLTLAYIDVCHQVAEIFLSSYPLLEQLSIRNSRVLEHLIIGPSLKLKHLEIYRCRIDYLEICNANLISFSFKGTKQTNLSLKNVSSVVNLQIEIYRESLPILIDLIATKFSEVEKLSLEVSCDQLRALDFHHSFPKFNNLKWLILSVVDCTLLEVTPLLQASPYLQMFDIKIDWSDTRIYGGTILPLPRRHLKVVRYEGYLGGTADEELINYLVKKSLALEKCIVSLCDQSYSKVERKARSQAWRQLQGKFSKGVELVIL